MKVPTHCPILSVDAKESMEVLYEGSISPKRCRGNISW